VSARVLIVTPDAIESNWSKANLRSIQQESYIEILMSGELIIDRPCWYAIHTNPQQEERTDSNLRRWGVETFNPRIRVRRFDRYTGRPTQVIKPLFTQYIFARFVADSLLHKVSFTRGVRRVVCFGAKPAPIDDTVIDFMRSKLDGEGLIRLSALKEGDNVTINDGNLQGISGIFEWKLKASDRVMILLTTTNYQGHLMVERELLQKVS
jgi:transcriptional antiterminator RfaH